MKKTRCAIFVCSMIGVCTLLATALHQQPDSKSNINLANGKVESEPEYSAALAGESQISVTHRAPIKFGALVGGNDDRFIELTPQGEVYTSGEINQSTYSYIGDTNKSYFSTRNHFYRIEPGRLVFDITHLNKSANITVSFLDGELTDNNEISLSRVNIQEGHNTSPSLLPLPADTPNQIKFQATEYLSNATVDLRLGGRLELSSTVSGEVDAPVTATITIAGNDSTDDWVRCATERRKCRYPTGTATIVRYGANDRFYQRYDANGSIGCNNFNFGDPISGTVKVCDYKLTGGSSELMPAAIATVHQHFYSRGLKWPLKGLGIYRSREIRNNNLQGAISGFKIHTGYQLKACTGDNLTGHCETFTNYIPTLPSNLNDRINSIELKRH